MDADNRKFPRTKDAEDITQRKAEVIKEVGKIGKRLQKLRNMKRAKVLQGFFKTGPGEYGEGDIFLGIRVPELRKLAKEYQDIPSREVRQLLNAPIHEERLLALLILVCKYSKGTESEKREFMNCT